MSALNGQALLRQVSQVPWQVEVMDSVDSTNAALKRRAQDGVATGTVLVTGCQTNGRGRLGRQFISPAGGIYLSVLLRPRAHLMRLTAAAAAAVRRAVFRVCGVEADIKWRNDLLLEGKKICGILAEAAFERGRLSYVILGVGINCNTAQFPAELAEIATSLAAATGKTVDETALAAAVIDALYQMAQALETGAAAWMEEYAAACITVGKTVRVVRGSDSCTAFATGVDADGGLTVRFDDGKTAVIDTGEVSVRGLNGYV